MSRLIRNTALLAKLETSYGVDAAPSGAANAMLVSDASFTDNQEYIDRNLIRPYLGASDQLISNRNLELSFTVELSGSGTAGTAPAWGPLLQACGFALNDATDFVSYAPVSDDPASVTIHWYADGVIRKAVGCRGTAELTMLSGERPGIKFSFTGLFAGVAEAAKPGTDLAPFKVPVAITNPNAADILLGCSYSAGALSGGTAYPSRGLSLNLGCEVKHIPLLGGESVEIVNRGVSGSVSLALTPAQEVAFDAAISGQQVSSLGFEFGTAAGNKIAIYAPSVQRLRPKDADFDGRMMHDIDLRLLPVSGNDELVVVVK